MKRALCQKEDIDYEWYYKCKRCKAEFKIQRLHTDYFKDVNFCPYCGIQAYRQPKNRHPDE